MVSLDGQGKPTPSWKDKRYAKALKEQATEIECLTAEGTELRGIIQVVLTAHELKGGEFDGLKAWINEELTAVSASQVEALDEKDSDNSRQADKVRWEYEQGFDSPEHDEKEQEPNDG